LNCNLPYVEQFGASLEKVLQLLESAVKRAQEQGTIIRIIAGISRDRGEEYVSYWVRRFLKYGIISGFDLHGLEVGWSANLFKEAFAPAREAGKKIKVHAGEMVGAESIRIAVEELGVNQIGHGTSAIADPTVVDLLVSRNVVVEMCPTSNERLRNVPSYREHPILELDKAGVAVTVNSDDPSFFGVNLTGEMIRLVTERAVDYATLARWTRNAIHKAILDEASRSAFEAELKIWLQNRYSDPKDREFNNLPN
jgi:adenosine deaminase